MLLHFLLRIRSGSDASREVFRLLDPHFVIDSGLNQLLLHGFQVLLVVDLEQN